MRWTPSPGLSTSVSAGGVVGGVTAIDAGDRRGRRREYVLQHAVAVLVDGPDAQRQPTRSAVTRKLVPLAVARRSAARPSMMSVEHARCRRIAFDLPDVVEGPAGDRPPGLSASVTPAFGDGQQLIHGVACRR